MSWEQWPFHCRSLTDMIGPEEDPKYNERFVSLLVSGCSERLGRPLTVLEPVIDTMGEPVEEPIPDNPSETRLKLRRIDQINPREHFAEFCDYLRQLPGQEEACRQCDKGIARQVIQAAVATPERLSELAKGYNCRMNLIDQVGVIQHRQTPVAVVFSGQFLSDRENGLAQVEVAIEDTAIEYRLTDEEQLDLQLLADELETPDEFIDRYIAEVGERDKTTRAALEMQRPAIDQLFLNEVKEIERIACVQFQMHKRNRESRFRHELRRMLPLLLANGREVTAEQTRRILDKVCEFCGTGYLALFISPQRYISFESKSNLLSLFAVAEIGDEIRSGIQHFNLRKAGLALSTQSSAEQQSSHARILIDYQEVQQALKSGLKGETCDFFTDATVLCQKSLSETYRAVLVWGPFPHLTAFNLKQEAHFLEEVSEIVMMRVLSSVQLSDSETHTEIWGEVAGLLGHYSRRAMNPVSTGVRIISDYLRGKETYSKEDALNACNSLEVASRVIAQAVRVPLSSFAARAEKVYEFAPASLDAIVRDCVALYRPMALEKSVTFRVDPSVAGLPEVEVDMAKMRDAIGYVLDNAIKYSHNNKEVRIYGELSGNHIRLTIEDFGQGIKDEERRLIFGRRYQGERSQKALYEEGEGMGLFHARLIVESHKGAIWCGCKSGPRSEMSARLEGYLVWFTFELPINQSDT
jgi:signal transduction histidine kinase/ligand-binding sensor protein